MKTRKTARKQAIFLLVIAFTVCLASDAGGIWVQPNSFDVNITEGCALTKTLTIGNDGIEDLDFIVRTRQAGSSGGSERIAVSSTTQREVILPVPQGHDFTVVSNTPYKAGELIVRFAAKADGRLRSLADKNQILTSLGGGNVKRNFNIVPGLSLVELPAGMTVEEALQIFNRANGILYAQPNYEVKAISTFPDDTLFDDLWGMHNTGQTGGTEDADIDAPEAWDIGTGSGEIIVAVIDTGVDYTHPDLAANMWVNEAELNGIPGVDDDGNGYVDDIYGYDFRNNDGDPMDDHYHGTHCAGTVGGVGNNAEGVAGVNWNVRIMALKFLSSGGSGWTSDAIDCVEYSTLMGANLSSNSWGGGGYNQGLKDAIDAAGAANMLFVAAAGNDGSNNDTYPHYPSSYDCESLVAVMSTDSDDERSVHLGWASNYGAQTVDLGAPGSSILSCNLGGGYRYLSGTSMATPHVAGACALLWSMNPVMSNDEVKDILLQTVDETLPGLCVSEGRLNLYNAILETKAPWIEIEPEEGTIGAGESNDVSVIFDAMELAPGTYGAEIVIISNDPCSPTIVPVTMTVNPDDLQVVPADGFESSGAEGGPFEPQCVVYILTNNNDTQSLNWTTWETEDWLAVEPNEGVLDPCDSIEVSVCISPDANLLDPNVYSETLVFQNTNSGSINPRSITLTVKPVDCFTEYFDEGDSDLEGLMLTFSPDGSGAYYEACREEVDEFPTDPNGGTFVPLGDDDFAEVFLGGHGPHKKVWFYGTQYNRFYIGSNGYITFGDGDTEYSASLENHFNMLRISGVFTDLTPPDVQCISYKKLGDRVAVTFENVPLYGDKTATNSFQVEVFYADGTIRITWLDVAEAECVAGLSRGRGLPPVFFEESDLNKYPPCWPWCDLNRDYFVNFADFAMFAKYWLDEDCSIPYWCGKSDLDLSGETDTDDLGIFSESWLTKVDWFLQPISHWKFDEGEGDIAYDSVGNNDGTIYGATWTNGKIGDYALEFDGVDDYVDCGIDTSLEPANLTIATWFKTQRTSGNERIVSKLDRDANGKYYGYGLLLRQDKGNKFYFEWFYGTTSGYSLSSTSTFQTNVWYFMAATFDDTTKEVNLYINGTKEANTTAIGSIAYQADWPLSIGRETEWETYFQGTIDEVRIYDRALSAEEIRQLYDEGRGYKASAPNPADGATGVDPNTVLSWSPGKDALSHDVYLGTDFDDVNDANTSSAVYMGNFDVNSFDPCGLELATAYYWRIDELDGSNTYKGDVWSFTTFDINLGLVSLWEFDEGEGTTAHDSAGDNDGTLVGNTNWVTGKIGDYALDFDGDGDYVEIPDDDSLNFGTGNFTISAWINVQSAIEGLNPGIVSKWENVNNRWYLHIFKANKIGFTSKTGGDWVYVVRTDAFLNYGQWYHVCFLADGSGKIYINGQDRTDIASYDPASLSNNATLKIGYNGYTSSQQYFDGTIDDVRIYDRTLSAEEIEELYRKGLGHKAFAPNPADEATGVDPNTILSWSPGKDALSHDVYLGTNYNDVNDADVGSPEYMGNFDVNSFDPCGLELETTYYWRIDEVDDSNTYKGDIWSFTTRLNWPIIITNVYELQAMQDYLDAWYELGCNIDASDTQNWNGGEGFVPVGTFTGTFDGKGYSIENLHIDRITSTYQGLFSTLSGAIVKNVNLIDADIRCDWGGVLAYGAGGASIITNCSTTGTLTLNSGSGDAKSGGLIGSVGGSSHVDRCFSGVDVDAGNRKQVGGLIGYLRGRNTSPVTLLSNSYSYGTVTGGGSKQANLLGDADGSHVDRCYSCGYTKALIGYNYGSPVITDCYWDKDKGASSSPYGGTPKTTVQMMQQSTFVNWDFVNIWDIIEGETYPFLR